MPLSITIFINYLFYQKEKRLYTMKPQKAQSIYMGFQRDFHGPKVNSSVNSICAENEWNIAFTRTGTILLKFWPSSYAEETTLNISTPCDDL